MNWKTTTPSTGNPDGTDGFTCLGLFTHRRWCTQPRTYVLFWNFGNWKYNENRKKRLPRSSEWLILSTQFPNCRFPSYKNAENRDRTVPIITANFNVKNETVSSSSINFICRRISNIEPEPTEATILFCVLDNATSAIALGVVLISGPYVFWCGEYHSS